MKEKLSVANIGMKFGISHVEDAKTVEVCLAIVESSKTGKPVNPDYNF